MVPWTEFQNRLATPEEREKWANNDIGIVTGPISRIMVLDIDGQEGAKSIAAYDIPRTWSVKTPHGVHHYFRWVDALDNKVTTRTRILEGVDVRGQGGYVKFYGWVNGPHNAPLSLPPQWLIDLLPNNGEAPKAAVQANGLSKFSDILNGIKDGNRNESFTRIAGGLRARGYKPDEIFDLLQSKAAQVSFSDSELRTVCNSVGRYEPKIVINDEQGQSVESFLENIQETKWLCEPIIANNTLGFVAGLPETGKTWVLIDLAIECARGGGMWLGKFPVKGCKVLFIDQERAKSETQRRFKAIIEGKAMETSSLSGKLWIRCGTTTRIDLQHSFDAFRKELAEIRPDLVIVDSLATFHTKEESNRMEIQQVMERIKALRNEFNCTFLIVHHETKMAHNNRKEGNEPSYLDMSGNVAIPAAAETVLNVVKHDDGVSMVHHTKSTLGIKSAPFLVQVRDLNLEKTKIAVEAF